MGVSNALGNVGGFVAPPVLSGVTHLQVGYDIAILFTASKR